MICPFCQFELDVATHSCPRCAAAYPVPAKPFSFRIRTMVAIGSMMMILTFTLVSCVVSYLPGWPNSLIACCSPQMAIQPMPNLKSPAVDYTLWRWQAGLQAQSTAEPNKHK